MERTAGVRLFSCPCLYAYSALVFKKPKMPTFPPALIHSLLVFLAVSMPKVRNSGRVGFISALPVAASTGLRAQKLLKGTDSGTVIQEAHLMGVPGLLSSHKQVLLPSLPRTVPGELCFCF